MNDVIATLNETCQKWQLKLTKDCKSPKYNSLRHKSYRRERKRIRLEATNGRIIFVILANVDWIL